MNPTTPFPFTKGESHLERCHPHIVERLRKLWGYPEGRRYLSTLLVDDRGGRQGFSREVFNEIIALSNQYPEPVIHAFEGQSALAFRRVGAGFDGSMDLSRRRAAL